MCLLGLSIPFVRVLTKTNNKTIPEWTGKKLSLCMLKIKLDIFFRLSHVTDEFFWKYIRMSTFYETVNGDQNIDKIDTMWDR